MNKFVSITSHCGYLIAITEDGKIYKIVIGDLDRKTVIEKVAIIPND